MLAATNQTNAMTASTAMTAPGDLTVLAASTGTSGFMVSVVPPATHAVGAFSLLSGRVRADRRADDPLRGVDADRAAGDGEREAVQPARRRPALLLAVA